ncbi:hypothetical protein OPQ81_007882 [Rhizoctonia solani]|nr:hypothetical protein OPQ81_007882 [Rhizoctonia solani]
MSLISSLLLDDSPLSSSTDVLQYSADGQISLVTRSAIHIVTPDFRTTSNGNGKYPHVNQLGWLRTAIHDFGMIKAWSEGRTEWNTLSLATAENVWQAASWSPSGLNRLGGCLLASLTNNLQLAIWAPAKNPSTGEWTRVADITEYQIGSYGGDDDIAPEDLLKCQSCAIAWSSSCYEATTLPPAAKYHPLLAVGARSGDLSFFRWDLSTDAARYCFSFKVADAWIIRLVWSKWKLVDNNNTSRFVQASLACGLSNGSVWVLNIKQGPDERKEDEQNQYSVTGSTLVVEPDSRSITAMTFVEMNHRAQPLLVVAKPGFVTLCSIPTPSENEMAEDPSLDTVMLASPRTSLASSAVSTCVGLQYIPSDDSLVVTLAEGSTIMIAGVSEKAHLREQAERQMSTYGLSRAVRRITAVAESRPLERAEYARIHGIQFMGTESYAIWAQEVLQSYDLSFRIQATFKTRLCLVKLWEPEEDLNIRLVNSLSVALSSHNLVTLYSPELILKEMIFELLDDNSVISAGPRLLPVLAPEWGLSSVDQFATEDYSRTTNDRFTSQTRLKLSLVQLLVKRAGLPDDLTLELRLLLRTLVETVVALRIQAVVERIFTLPESEKPENVDILRFIHASQFCPVPVSLVQRFQNMRQQGQEYSHKQSPNLTYFPNDGGGNLGLSRAADLGEKCPACQQVVLFQNLAQAQCQMGHVWERCATSFRLLASLGSLTCSGCGRKTLDYNPLIFAEPGTHCVMCGNRYFRAL